MEQQKTYVERHSIAENVYVYRTAIANIAFITGLGPKGKDWILIDAGIPLSGGFIIRFAEKMFGRESRPLAVMMTHAHFDHIGGLKAILSKWDVPVYAHRAELPYLTGKETYPPADPAVGRGLMALISPLYPRRPINIGENAKELPEDATLPGLPGWRWIHTPGHTPGHVSFFRDDDGVLLAGDAFITVKQESLMAVMSQSKEIHGPPAYFTPDWDTAGQSIRKLAALNPKAALTGHGQPFYGQELTEGLEKLIKGHETFVVPKQGKYVH
ncbi:MBL fold metallo-hydrolase [Bacillus infantis]|jgi:glyoxylase-like metal-dependent hydrolase (beta-lactamase superfamily II)|uniref:MBL fold metallo-hydrolase n=1 Tax=Bacillus infantis TaxID=324767 RepID=UPI002155DCE1|nr:MBL fold metallo-hydrolase [Bacillus infantis]MCR6611504.1 MBL fold metallo-hydrolase [Bacillus infantis]